MTPGFCCVGIGTARGVTPSVGVTSLCTLCSGALVSGGAVSVVVVVVVVALLVVVEVVVTVVVVVVLFVAMVGLVETVV